MDTLHETTLPLRPGAVLNGKWTLGSPLGRCGAALVYEAFHRNGMRMAASVLAPEGGEAEIEEFLRDAASLEHLENVGPVAAFDDDRTADGLVFVVYERLDER